MGRTLREDLGQDAGGGGEVARGVGAVCSSPRLRRGSWYADATAAKSIAERQGLVRVRHIDVGLLWLQDLAVRERLHLHKVLWSANPADLMTKHVSGSDVYLHKVVKV